MVIGGARSEAERAAASRALLEWGFSEWRAQTLFGAGKTVSEARVQHGDARSVALVTDRAIAATLPNTGTEPIALRVVYAGPLVAPIVEGAQVATLEIRAGGGPPSRLPLVAASAVGKAGPLDRIVNGILGLVS